jgi:hypothetical protein
MSHNIINNSNRTSINVAVHACMQQMKKLETALTDTYSNTVPLHLV